MTLLIFGFYPFQPVGFVVVEQEAAGADRPSEGIGGKYQADVAEQIGAANNER